MTDDELAVRLQAAIAVHKRRKQLREMARAQLVAARAYGLEVRQSQKLRRARVGDTTRTETSK